MSPCRLRHIGAAAIGLVVFASTSAHGQVFEAVGTRAQGMGGAFVAIADDATASWWNPAGLASGAYFNVIFERGRTTQPQDISPVAPGRRTEPTAFAAAFPALGLSYYHLHINEIRPIGTTAPASGGRQNEVSGVADVKAQSISQFGITVGQSLGQRFVIGSTLKLVRAGAVSTETASSDPLAAANDLDVPVETHADLDVGAMAFFGRIRLGLTVKNVSEPNFGTAEGVLTLKRRARAGIALLAPSRGPAHAWAVAVDADLTATPTVFGDVRHVAGGAEAWFARRRIGVRGGATANTIGDLRPTWSGGLSFALSRGVFLDGALAAGSDKTLRAWSTTLRFTL